MNELKITTLNISNGLQNYNKLLAVKQFCREEIILLQETRGKNNETLWKKYLGREGKFSFYEDNARGAAALINLDANIKNTFNDKQGRIAAITTTYKEKKLGIISVYAPNTDKSHEAQRAYVKHLMELERIIDMVKKDSDFIIVGGDFNLILDPKIDAEKSSATTHDILIEEIQDMLSRCELTDAIRTLYPNKRLHTYAPGGENKKKVYRRLDHFYVSDNLAPFLDSVEFKYCHFSDHKAVTLNLKFKNDIKRRTIWRHNDEMLKIPEYIRFIESEYKKIIDQYKEDMKLINLEEAEPCNLWEFIKFKLGESSRSFGTELAKERRKITCGLKLMLEDLSEDPQQNHDQIITLKDQIDLIETEEDRKKIFHSRVHFVEHNEKMTGFFLRKIKKNQAESNVIELINEKGNMISLEETNDEIYKFYKKLFERRETEEPSGDMQEILNQLPKLNKDQSEHLEEEISLKEVGVTLFKYMNPGKSPGNDGLTVSFYKKILEYTG